MVIVGISNHAGKTRRLFAPDEDGYVVVREVENINAYLVPGPNVIIEKASSPIRWLARMDFGSKPVDGGNLLLTMMR